VLCLFLPELQTACLITLGVAAMVISQSITPVIRQTTALKACIKFIHLPTKLRIQWQNAFILKLGKIITDQCVKSEQFLRGKNGKKNVS
jgi:hypothetical protein